MFLHAARQPILDNNQKIYAYQLLFRDDIDSFFIEAEKDARKSRLITTGKFEHSLHELTSGQTAHIHFNLASVCERHPRLLPADQVTIEINAADKPTKRLLKECIHLHKTGYKIVLDDYAHQKSWSLFYPYIEMIKIDMFELSDTQLKHIFEIKKQYRRIKIAAKNIQTHDQFIAGKILGADLFQGYFFTEPQPSKEKPFDPSNYYLTKLMLDISNEDFDVNDITETFQSDVSLSYKILRYSNSAVFKKVVAISSIKQAVVSLGKDELLKFVTILYAVKVAHAKPLELISMALLRAKMSEGIAISTGKTQTSSMAFLTGMLSLIDAIMDEPLREILSKMSLDSTIIQALLEGEGDIVNYIDIVKGYENAQWKQLDTIVESIGLEADDIAKVYQESLTWVHDKMQYITE